MLWWRRYDCATRIQAQARRLFAVAIALGIIADLERRAFGASGFTGADANQRMAHESEARGSHEIPQEDG